MTNSADRPNDGVTASPLLSQTFVDSLRRSAATGVFIANPVESVAGASGMALAKRISSGVGDDFGVVAAVVAPSAIDGLIAPFVIGEHGSIALIRADGAIVDRVPAVDSASGGDIAADELDARYGSRRRAGAAQGVSAIDGDHRLSAVANLPHFPLAVVAAVATSDWYAAWLRQLEWIALRTIAVAMVIAVGSVKLAQSVDQLSEARKSAAVQAQMAIHYKRFNSAMDAIVQGVALFDADMRLITCNRRYAEIYDLPAEVTQPGAASAEGNFPPSPRCAIRRCVGGTSHGTRRQRRHDQRIAGRTSDLAAQEEARRRRLGFDPRGRHGLSSRGGKGQGNGDDRRPDRSVESLRIPTAVGTLSRRGRAASLASSPSSISTSIASKPSTTASVIRSATSCCRPSPRGSSASCAVEDTVARLGGDEFAVIQRITAAPGDPARLADRLIAAVGEPYLIDENAVTIGVSVGISVAPKDGVVVDELIRAADVALYHAKAERRGGYTFFEKAMDEQVQARRQMESDLRVALAENQFRLDFQPVVAAADRTVKSLEALLRWRHPVRGNVPPSDFIPLAEEVGLIVPIGEWVIREACKQAAKWPRHIKVAVNVLGGAIASRPPSFRRSSTPSRRRASPARD